MKLIKAYGQEILVRDYANYIAIDDSGLVCSYLRCPVYKPYNSYWIDPMPTDENTSYNELFNIGKITFEEARHSLIKITDDNTIAIFENLENL